MYLSFWEHVSLDIQRPGSVGVFQIFTHGGWGGASLGALLLEQKRQRTASCSHSPQQHGRYLRGDIPAIRRDMSLPVKGGGGGSGERGASTGTLLPECATEG